MFQQVCDFYRILNLTTVALPLFLLWSLRGEGGTLGEAEDKMTDGSSKRQLKPSTKHQETRLIDIDLNLNF